LLIQSRYVSVLGNLNSNSNRKEYAERAKVILKVRHMLLDVLKDENRSYLIATPARWGFCS